MYTPSSVQPPVMDENERIALQEKEDERLARELEAREHSGGNLEVWPEYVPGKQHIEVTGVCYYM